MTTQILHVLSGTGQADGSRSADYAAFLRRLAQVQGEEGGGRTPAMAPDRALAVLAAQGRLFSGNQGETAVWYVPSVAGKRHFLAGPGGWPEPLYRRQLKRIRQVPGATIRFPVEQSQDQVEVFITDWSPSPAAAALAVHPDHPVAAAVRPEGRHSFTGKFVRHPLTGDLLPVWVADWVKPEFGTGAVLVNPAHDPTDLAFARAVGLPVRFGLVPDTFTGEPETWPEPPIVKTGRTIKTGFYDGHTALAALEHYFSLLAARGFAQRHVDIQAGPWPIATLVADERGPVGWCERCHRLHTRPPVPDQCPLCQGGLVRRRVKATEWLELLLALDPAIPPNLVAPAPEQVAGLVFLRLAYFDLYGTPLVPAAVHVVQPAQEAQARTQAPDAVSRLAALVAAPADQVAVVRRQVCEQVQSFLATHGEFVAAAPWAQAGLPDPGTEPGPFWPEAVRVSAAVEAGDPARAFAGLYGYQKQLRRVPSGLRLQESGFLAYFALTFVLLGLEPPEGVEPARIWGRLGGTA